MPVDWSSADLWLFALLSYDGGSAINRAAPGAGNDHILP